MCFLWSHFSFVSFADLPKINKFISCQAQRERETVCEAMIFGLWTIKSAGSFSVDYLNSFEGTKCISLCWLTIYNLEMKLWFIRFSLKYNAYTYSVYVETITVAMNCLRVCVCVVDIDCHWLIIAGAATSAVYIHISSWKVQLDTRTWK